MKLIAIATLVMLVFAAAAMADEICKDSTAPTAPSWLTISDSPYDADGNIILSWGAAADTPECSGIDHYNVYKSNDSVNFALLGQTDSYSFSDSGLEVGKTYYYRVTAVDKVVINPHEGPYIQGSTTIGNAPSSSSSSSGGSSSSSSSSSGGGGGYVPVTTTTTDSDAGKGGCLPEWNCGEWSECADGVQERKCVDDNECSSEGVTLTERRECEPISTETAPEEESLGEAAVEEQESGGSAFAGTSAGTWTLLILMLALLALTIYRYFYAAGKKKRGKGRK